MRDIRQKILDLIIEEASYLETKDEVRAVYSVLMSISLEIGEIMRQIRENKFGGQIVLFYCLQTE